MTELAPMLRALRRHPAMVVLLVFEIVLVFAILANLIALAWQRVAALASPSGILEQRLYVANAISTRFGALPTATYQEAVHTLLTIPGIAHAAVVDAVPFSGNDTWKALVSANADIPGGADSASIYCGDTNMLTALGVTIESGRAFHDNEYMPASAEPLSGVHVAILSKSLARRLFQDRNPLGRIIDIAGHDVHVIGIATNLARPTYYGLNDSHDSLLLPVLPSAQTGQVLLARAAADTSANVALMKRELDGLTTGQARWRIDRYTALRNRLFSADRIAAGFLSAASFALVLVSGCGIAGLSCFWVRRRNRQVAIRRALGARRSQIVAYFLIENLMISLAGVILGSVAAFAINLTLVRFLSVPILPVGAVCLGALLVMLLSQTAALMAVWRAGSMSPAMVMRSQN